jgi:hypothetical protein
MPKHTIKRFKPKRSHGGKRVIREGPAPGAASFKGPIHVRHKDDTIDVNLFEGYVQTVTASSGAWTNNSVFASSAVTSAPNWSDYSSAYQDFRVIGMSVEWYPTCENATPPNSAVAQCTPMFLCPSQSEQTAISGDLAAWAHEGKSCRASNMIVKSSVRMNGTSDAQWNTTASGTTNSLCIKSYMAGTSTSASSIITLGHFYLQYNVQFRRSVVTNTSFADKSQQRSSSVPIFCIVPSSSNQPTKDQKDSKQKSEISNSNKDSKCSALSNKDALPSYATPPLIRQDGHYVFVREPSSPFVTGLDTLGQEKPKAF